MKKMSFFLWVCCKEYVQGTSDSDSTCVYSSIVKPNITMKSKKLREDIQKKNCRFGENGTIGGEGVRKIIEFSSFTNDEKHGRGGVSE